VPRGHVVAAAVARRRPLPDRPPAIDRGPRPAGTTNQERTHHMADITAAAVKDLRERTGAGFMDCKNALVASDGDVEKAVAILREKGLAAAAKRADRDAREGLVSSYLHTGGRLGVLIEVNCETDFVARTDEFQKLVRDLAIQVAGMTPLYVDADAIPTEIIAAKRAELLADPATQKKPESIRPQIVDGQLNKWFSQVCLLDQPFRDEERTVRDLVTEKIATIGENIRVRRFVRYALGEEL
jgi:elongation factor Ts